MEVKPTMTNGTTKANNKPRSLKPAFLVSAAASSDMTSSSFTSSPPICTWGFDCTKLLDKSSDDWVLLLVEGIPSVVLVVVVVVG